LPPRYGQTSQRERCQMRKPSGQTSQVNKKKKKGGRGAKREDGVYQRHDAAGKGKRLKRSWKPRSNEGN